VQPWRAPVAPRDLRPRGAGGAPGASFNGKRGRNARATAEATAGGAAPAGKIEITFGRGGVDLYAVPVGAIVWKTDDPAIRRRLETTFARDTVARRVPVTAHVAARVGGQLTVTVCDDLGHEATVSWDKPLERAQKFPLTPQVFADQFGRLGDTPVRAGGRHRPRRGQRGDGAQERV
jgi:hypothetical protein